MLRIASRSALATIAAFGLVFAAPLAAEARDEHRGRHGYKSHGYKDHGHYRGRGHHDDRGHHARHRGGVRGDRGHHARHHHHRGKYESRHAYAPYRGRYDYARSVAPRYRRSVVVHSPFYCGPCGHGFTHRRHFDRHLTHHHGIAVHALSSVIVQTLRGLFYYGY